MIQTNELVKADPFAVMQEMQPVDAYQAAEDDRSRFFFYAGDEPGRQHPGGLSVNTPCIPYRLIRRCQVTPCISRQIPRRWQEIPEGRIIHGTQDFIDEKGHAHPGKAKQWLYAGPEAETLLTDYGNKQGDPTKQWGLIELLPDEPGAKLMLTGRDWVEVIRELAITEVIFPQWPDVPETNLGIVSHLKEMAQMIEDNANPVWQWSPNDIDSKRRRDLYLACIPQMIRAAENADNFQMRVVKTSNIAVTLPSTEPGYKHEFDERDYLFSRRTGIELAINSLRQNSSNAIENLVKTLADKLQPQSAGVDANMIGAIVAATMAAMGKDQPALPPAETKPQQQALPTGKTK